MSPRRRRSLAWWLVVLLIVVPVVEIYVIIQVGQVIGAWWTVLLLILDGFLGGWLIRREGARAWRALRVAVEQGRVPADELADGALVVIGGTLMLSPGFVSDAVGVLLIIPITRPTFRRLLAGVVATRLTAAPPFTGPPNATHPGAEPGGPVVRGEVVDD